MSPFMSLLFYAQDHSFSMDSCYNSSYGSPMSRSEMPMPSPLQKHKSWSPESNREETWLRRVGIHQDRRRRVDGTLTRSVTDEDLDELRGCIDLGFGFDLDETCSDSDSTSSRSLVDTIPALDLYYTVNCQYSEAVSGIRSPTLPGSDPSSAGSSPSFVYSPGESPEHVKEKLRQWAQVVAYAVKQQRNL